MKDRTRCHVSSTTLGASEQERAEQFVSAEQAPSGTARSRELCQIESAPSIGSLRRPAALYGPFRLLWRTRNDGLRYTVAIIFERIALIVGSKLHLVDRPRTPGDLPDEVLNLKPGDLVEVKSEKEIAGTLDRNGRHYGLTFTPEMRKHCGERHRVFKRLEFMFDEYRHTQRRLRNTVLLDNVHCTGEGIGCDRACFLFWREVWLRRVEEPVADAEARTR